MTVGANTVNGVSFSVADPSELYDEARKAAFADARAKAELYATAAGGTLDDIVSISESPGLQQPPALPHVCQRADMAAERAVPVEAGELSFAINVNVQWELEHATSRNKSHTPL